MFLESSFVVGVEPLTRPRPSGTLSRQGRQGRGLWLDAKDRNPIV
jgi:hypothetical protein